jgi:periplasmic protein TonB
MGLDRAAVEAVEKWRFKPAMLEGRPVKVYYVLTVNFQVQ